jgi:hypothetical protein
MPKGKIRELRSTARGTRGIIVIDKSFNEVEFRSPDNNNEIIPASKRELYMPVEFDLVKNNVHNLKLLKRRKK